MKTLYMFAALWTTVALSGCKSTVPKPGVTAADGPRVAACQSIGNAYNGILIGDILVGGVAPALGGVGTALPSSSGGLKTGLEVSGIVLSALEMTGVTLASVESSAFESGQCTDVVGALPDLPPAPHAVAPEPTVTSVPVSVPVDAGADR